MEKDDDASRWAVAYTFQVRINCDKIMLNKKFKKFWHQVNEFNASLIMLHSII